MARVIGTALQIAGVFTGSSVLFYIGTAINFTDSVEQSRRQRRRAKALFNEAQKDRLEMVDRNPNQAGSLCMGRVRYVEGVRRFWQSGVHLENLTMFVSAAAHEIDGIEQFYLHDTPVTLNAQGWVNEEPWNKISTYFFEASGILDSQGKASIQMPGPLLSGAPIAATWVTSASWDGNSGPLTIDSIVGTVVNVSGGPPGEKASVTAQAVKEDRKVRIRPYMGSNAQSVGGDVAAEYPGKIRTSDHFKSVAGWLVDCKYDPDVFPQGRPSVTAVFRGARLYDPRKDSTVPGGSGAHRFNQPNTWEWSRNPALQVLRYATWEFGMAIPIADINLQDIIEAANVCDAQVSFTLRKSDNTTSTVSLPRYQCDIVIGSDADRRASMDSIVETMNGRWCWAGGMFRVRAGAKKAPVATVTEAWLSQSVDEIGTASGQAVIRGNNGVTRDRRVNRITGRCFDPDQRYQMVAFPAVQDSVLVSAKGVRPEEVEYEGVAHIAHAQHLASMTIRKAQAGLRLELTCGLRALKLQLLDVVSFDVPLYGFSGNEAEVVSWSYGPGGVITMQLEEISNGLFTIEPELKGRDPAPDSSLRKPWEVEKLTGLLVDSGTAQTQDGSIITRTVVSWNPAVGENIRNGGEIEVQYADLTQPLPAGDWPSWIELGNSSKAIIPGPLSGRRYFFRARAVQKVPLVRGPWSDPYLHEIARPPDAASYSLAVGISAIVLPADSAGNVTSFAGASASPKVLKSGVDDTSSWALSRTNGPNVTSSFAAGVLTVTALSADSGYIDVTASQAGLATLQERITITKNKQGAGGTASFAATIYWNDSAAPSLPTGGSYNFSTATLTAPSGWLTARPAPGVNNIYQATQTFSGAPAANVSGGAWSDLTLIEQGSRGPVGVIPNLYILAATFVGQSGPNPTAAFEVRADGNVWMYEGATNSLAAVWYSPSQSGVGANYEIRADVNLSQGAAGGTSGSAFGAWIDLNVNRTWSLTMDQTGTRILNCTYSIRDKTTNKTVCSGTFVLEATIEF